MSESYEIEVFTQNSIYNKSEKHNQKNRKLKVYFSVPQNGVNEDTGLLLLIAGFGGHSNSNVYKKMRDKFADEYNLVTIQCDYFGYEFMQDSEKILPPNIDKEELKKIFTNEEVEECFKDGGFDFKVFLKNGSRYNIEINVQESLNENIDDFNDMGFLQAIDNITAVLNVMNILYENNYSFNSKKIIIYGYSHGAYLAYLCNAFAPKLFSLIIDNSAWLYPQYLKKNQCRGLYKNSGNLRLKIMFVYLAANLIDDTELLNLSYLYSKFDNNCNIISYHGSTDELITCLDKKIFCNNISKCMYNEIEQGKIDNIIFKSTNHGLDADFIELFNYSMSNLNFDFPKENSFDLVKEVIYETGKHKYIINYENIRPEVIIL